MTSLRVLTKAEILAMPPSGELDAHVAEKIMGWQDCFDTGGRLLTIGATNVWRGRPPGNLLIGEVGTPVVPSYSGSLIQAWEVVERIVGKEQVTAVVNDGGWYYGDTPKAKADREQLLAHWRNTWEIQAGPGMVFVCFSEHGTCRTRGAAGGKGIEDLPLVICRAALLAMLPEEEGL